MNPDKSIEDRYKGIKTTNQENTVADNILDAFNLVFQPENAIPFDVTGTIQGVRSSLGGAVPYFPIVTYTIPINANKGVLKYAGYDIDNDFMFGFTYYFFLRINQTLLASFTNETLIRGTIAKPDSVLYTANGGDIIDLSVKPVPQPLGGAFVNYKCYARIKGWYI